MALITHNFRLNALANQYATALYSHISSTSTADCFMVNAGGQAIQVNIVGGIKGVRDLIDGYALEALKGKYPNWEEIGIQVLNRCVSANKLTKTGLEIWQSMVNDMGGTVAQDL